MLNRREFDSDDVSGLSRTGAVLALVAVTLLVSACDKAQLLAPTRSTITVTAPTRQLAAGATTPVTAFVQEESGTPVQNGTTVRFTTTLGRVEPVEAQTQNGIAVTTFFADNNSGIAEVQAVSGAATPGDPVRITIGAAAVNTISVRANPGSVGPGGGTVELVAVVVGENGQPLPGVVVTFNSDKGSLSSATATTNAAGEARTSLTTSEQASVTATAGTRTSTAVTVGTRAGPAITITCLPSAVGTTSSCGAIQANTANNSATVTFTVTRATGSSGLRNAIIDFGDGTSQNLGNLAGGTTTVTHTYSGPSDSNARTYTATVTAVDINGEVSGTSTNVVVTPRATPTPLSANLTATESSRTMLTARWTFRADVTGGGEGTTPNAPIQSYTWDFGDGDTATTSGNQTSHVYERDATDSRTERREVTVTARTADGRTATAREEIVVQYNATDPLTLTR
jgi:hypothetical protein